MTQSAPPLDGVISDFHSVLVAKLNDVELTVFQEVLRLEKTVAQLSTERDGLLRDLAEARGLVLPRSFREAHDLQQPSEGEGGTRSSLSVTGSKEHEVFSPAVTPRSHHSRLSILRLSRSTSNHSSPLKSKHSSPAKSKNSSPQKAQRDLSQISPPMLPNLRCNERVNSGGSQASANSSPLLSQNFSPPNTLRSMSPLTTAIFGERLNSRESLQEHSASGSLTCYSHNKQVPARMSTPLGTASSDPCHLTVGNHIHKQLPARVNTMGSAASSLPCSLNVGYSDLDEESEASSKSGSETSSNDSQAEFPQITIEPPCPPVVAGVDHSALTDSEKANKIAIDESSTKEVKPTNEPATQDTELPVKVTGKRRESLISAVSSNEGSITSSHLTVTFELLAFWLNKMLEIPEEATCSKLMKIKKAANVSDILRFTPSGRELVFQGSTSNPSSVSSNAEHLMKKSCMMHPTSPVSATWELVSLGMIGYDFVVLPLQIFSPQETLFTIAMEWAQRLFWTISIPYCFSVGYMLRDGKVELRPWKVAQHYASTWFLFDVTVVVSDWAEVILESLEFLGTLRFVKTLRISRLLRMMRIFRSSKLPKVIEELDTRIFSEKAVILLGIAKISVLFACLGHLVACSWYGIGRYGSDNGSLGWVCHYDYLRDGLLYRYATSLHWALTQFIGSMDIQPQTLAERLFANVVLMCSFVITAWLVSSITARLTRLQIIAGGRDGQFAVLRQYLKHHKISTKLGMRVMKSAQGAIDHKMRNASEEDVELLTYVSEPLRAEIHYEMYFATISMHPLFKQLEALNHQVVRQLCHTAVDVMSVDDGDFLFSAGDSPAVMCVFFLLSGYMEYACEDRTLPVSANMWACEAVLWTQWVHLGDMCAYHAVTILALNAEAFRQVLMNCQREAYVAANYAKRFVEYFNQNWDAVLDVNMHMDNERWTAEAVAQSKTPREPGLAELLMPRRPSITTIGLALNSKMGNQAAVQDLSSIIVSG